MRETVAQEFADRERSSRLHALLNSWIEVGDPAEQRETGRFLVEALDVDRLSSRPLFPPDLEGVTW